MLLAVRIHDHVELDWLRLGPGRFVEIHDTAPPLDLASPRIALTPCEGRAFVELELAAPVVWDRDRLDDALEDWLAQ
jgi:hypothetical protein